MEEEKIPIAQESEIKVTGDTTNTNKQIVFNDIGDSGLDTDQIRSYKHESTTFSKSDADSIKFIEFDASQLFTKVKDYVFNNNADCIYLITLNLIKIDKT